MEIKKFLILIIILNITNFVFADTINPTKNLTAYDVIKIQLNALKNNNKPKINSGIEQTWMFAHPENKKITGPYDRFQKMLLGDQYKFLLNHESHKIKLIMNFYEWHLEKSTTKNCNDCWFTTRVSPPKDKGNII
jgi:hypothetical protein